MDTIDIKQQAIVFEKARNNLLAVIAFTAINLILTAFNANINFLFSASLPQFVLQLGKSLEDETGMQIYMIVALVIAVIIIVPYLVFWLLARRVRGLILAALIYFGIDSLVLLDLIIESTNTEFDFSVLLEIIFHGWILYYLINGVRAWSKMRGVNTDDFKAVLHELKFPNINSNMPNVSDKPPQEE
ncbi:MAG: hypothetical protein LBV17_12165 [Treponema sp.]|jgi:hypothetical protein|nr:hypothetical protein [Treponema sp.]